MVTERSGQVQRDATKGLISRDFWVKQALIFVIAFAVATAHAWAQSSIAYVQGTYAVPQINQAAVSATFPAAQTSGNLNVIAIGWNDATSHVTTVTDTGGNLYAPALAPTVQAGVQSHVIYYAANIAGVANTVTVTFDGAASYPDIRIAEYRGLDPITPLAGAIGASGVGSTADSGALNAGTTAPILLVGASYVQSVTIGPGAGFTSRLLTTPNGSILEDQILATPAPIAATAVTGGSGWVMQQVAFRGAQSGSPVDTQPPTAPASATATAVSSSRISLSWSAATDDVGVVAYRVERCQGPSCTTFGEIAVATTVTYDDAALSASTAYTYRVRAVDAAGNLSAYSPTATATTLAGTPNVPISYVQSAYSVPQTPTSVVSVTFPAAQSASDLNVIAIGWNDDIAHVINVTDSAGNLYQPALAPAVQPGIQSHVVYYAANVVGGTNTVTVTFNTAASFPDVRIAEYRGVDPITPLDGAVGTSGTGSTSTSGTLAPSGAPVLLVAANYVQSTTIGPGGGFTSRLITSPNGSILEDQILTTATPTAATASTGGAGWVMQEVAFRGAQGGAPPVDTQPPTVPSSATATALSSTRIALAWSASTDNVGVTGYRIERCQGSSCTAFVEIGSTSTIGYSDTGLTLATPYRYRMRATDAAGNLSAYSAIVTATTQTAPLMTITQPLDGATVNSSTVAVSYVVSGDLTEVNHAHFQVDGGPELMDLTLDGVFQLTNVAPGSHSLRGFLVRSDHSKILGTDSVITFSVATVSDTQAPTAPSSSTATAVSSSRISLSWSAATDDVGVVAYRVERCQGTSCTAFAEIAVATALTYDDNNLSASTAYSYRVRAVDAAGNLGPYSPLATTTTLASTPVVPISYVQSAYAVPQTPHAVVSATFAAAQTAGDLNVIAIGWNDDVAHVSSVTDSAGNLYLPALAPTVQTGIQSQVIYYATNIAGGANTVTVTFDTAASFPDMRIAEYRGIDPVFPLDGGSGASGMGSTSTSGTLTPTLAPVLLVAANYVQTTTFGPGSGYTSRLITTPNGSILEDRVLSTVGASTATASTGGAGWVMQQVAFRGASSGPADTQSPTAPGTLSATPISSNQISLTWGPASDNIGVAAYRVERCQGAGCATFALIAVTQSLNHDDGGLVASTSYSYRVRATDAAGNLGPYTAIVTATTPNPPPASISIILPAEGTTVLGLATFGATVTGAITHVQFQVDNVNVGPPVTASSTISINTAQFSNGVHTVRAYGWDLQHNITTAQPITVTFSNASPGNPAQTGLWTEPFSSPMVSLNLTLMGNGRVLMWDRMSSGNPDPHVWDPLTNSFLAVPTQDGTNLFCAGQVILPDGRVFVAGGHAADDVGLATGRIFDPATNLWSSTPDMSVGRWYPSVTVLPDGRVLTMSGEVHGIGDYAPVPEVYDPATNTWTSLPLASLSLPYYPHTFVLPNGRVAVTGTAELPVPTRELDVATQTWTTVSSQLIDGYSSAMYLPGTVLKTGTSTNSLGNAPSSSNAYVIDLTASTPQWRQVQSMANPRAYHVETLLPDGSVLVTGGGRTTALYDIPNAVYAAELWSPTTETWTTLASAQKPRLYHSTALLLADGRVLVTGGGRGPGPDPRDQENLEIFAPPYLFNGPRPSITAAPDRLLYGQNFSIESPDVARIAKVTLVAVGNMTHGINMSQRYLPLAFAAGGNQLTVTAPADANIAPPGVYMLFVIDTEGVPSLAAFVKL